MMIRLVVVMMMTMIQPVPFLFFLSSAAIACPYFVPSQLLSHPIVLAIFVKTGVASYQLPLLKQIVGVSWKEREKKSQKVNQYISFYFFFLSFF